MASRVVIHFVAFISMIQAVAVAQTQVDAKLAEYRAQIDQVDRQMVDLLNRRAAIVEQVGNLKKAAGLPVSAPAREQQVLDRIVEAGKNGPLPAAVLRRIYQAILQEMRSWEAAGSATK